MELKSIFQMTKTDRYTQDGRDELAKLQETEDVKYKTGDISQKTGLQKQPDGSWAPPKGGAHPKMGSKEYNEKYGLSEKDVKTGAEIDKIYEKHQKRIKELKAKGYTDEQIENDKIYQQTKEDMRNVGKSKPAEKHPPMVMPKGMHPAEFMKAWEDDAKKNGYKKGQGNEWREHLRNEESKPGRDYPILKKEDHVSLANEVKSNTMPGSDWTAEEIAKEWKLGKADAEEVKKEFDKIKESKPAEANKPAERSETEPKHTLEVGSKVKFKKSGQPITIKKIENYGGTPIVVGEYDYNGKRETNRFRLDELDYEQKEERKALESGNTLEEGKTVKFKKTGQPIKIKKVEHYGSTPVIVGEYEHNGKTETNRFRMDEIETPDSAPRILTGDTKIRIRK